MNKIQSKMLFMLIETSHSFIQFANVAEVVIDDDLHEILREEFSSGNGSFFNPLPKIS